jgi:hypothetical protein
MEGRGDTKRKREDKRQGGAEGAGGQRMNRQNEKI